jgi:hypothetical protein
MVNQSTNQKRRALWDAMLDAEMNVNYWEALCQQFVSRDRRLKFLIALTSSGTAIAAWAIWAQYPIAWKIITGASCVVSIYHSYFFHSERISKVSGLLATWKEIMTKYQLLWEKDRDLQNQASWKEFESSKQRESHIDESIVPKNEKLLNQAQQQVLKARGLQ